MQIILLSGGSGKRLWPLSNDVRSKQFIKIFKNEKGEFESMVQRMYHSLKTAMPDCNITIATGKSQVSSISNQLGNNVDVCIEPARRDTFPAIALACSYLLDEKKVDRDESVVVCPVDPYVEAEYFDTIKKIGLRVSENKANITLMGIKPTYPSEKYGYIVPNSDGTVKEFKEKPDMESAKALISEGALWNGGVFGFKLGYLIDKAHELIEFKDYKDFFSQYESINKISIDYAVVENEPLEEVLEFDGEWMDVGTWQTLTKVMSERSIGKVEFDTTCSNTHVLNEMDVPVIAMGLKDIVVAASPDGILVADKHQSSYMKPLVDKLEGPAMYAEKSWGSYKILDVEEDGVTLKVTLLPGHSMNYHSHEHRDETWTVLSGDGIAVIDGIERRVSVGDVIMIPKGSKHTIEAMTELKLLEVQLGKDISVSDKFTHELKRQKEK